VLTIGAGGGSIAWLDAAGGLHVGPRSAGARPGPICYGRGGTEPTVTDAFLALGLLDPGGLAAGSLVLELEAARAAFERLGAALGLEADAAAEGVIRVATMRMVDQVRLVSVGRGIDPRGLALVALGGAGSMFAGAVAAELGISQVVIPPVPGALSALGLFVAPVEHGVSETVAVRASAAEPHELESTYRALERRVRALMDAEGASESGIVSRRSVDARYVGQGSTVEVSVDSPIDGRELRAIGVAIHERHRSVHGHAQPGNPVELLNARVVQSWWPEEARFAAAEPPPSTERRRAARFGGDVLDAVVVGRGAVTGERQGPLIVEQPDTTILVAPGHRIAPDGSGNLILRVS
jgi:N-methylhydantoinase A/oxoprolinase/acetone carboxylase beta subunit